VHAHIPQHYTVLPSAKEQLPHLIRSIAHDQLANPGQSKIMVFLNTTMQTQLFASLLNELSKTLPVPRSRIYEIHSKRSQNARTKASQAFRKDHSGAAILVTSDVSARGIDYPGVTRVIQVGGPKSTEQYVHRIGRTGRAGKGGRADLLLLPFEQDFVRYQLSDMPIKELSHDNLLTETASLAEKFETDPTTKNRLISNKPGTALAKLDTEVPALFEKIDEEAIREVFASLVGFYLPQAENMRVTRRSVYEGVQAWTTEACGLPKAPYISDALLAKMGGLDGRSSARGAERGPRKTFGFKRPATRYMNSEGNRQRNDWPDREVPRAPRWGQDEPKWMGRGSRSSRDGERRDGEWRKSSRPSSSEWSRDRSSRSEWSRDKPSRSEWSRDRPSKSEWSRDRPSKFDADD
jgi:ATP-dependent RNA helicase MSS116